MTDTAESADVLSAKATVTQADAAASGTGTVTPASADPVFTKEQLAASQKYIHKSDLVMAVLAEGKTYTIAQADTAIQVFLDKEVD